MELVVDANVFISALVSPSGKTCELFFSDNKIKQIMKNITNEDYQKASIQLNHSPEEIKRVIELLL